MKIDTKLALHRYREIFITLLTKVKPGGLHFETFSTIKKFRMDFWFSHNNDLPRTYWDETEFIYR